MEPQEEGKKREISSRFIRFFSLHVTCLRFPANDPSTANSSNNNNSESKHHLSRYKVHLTGKYIIKRTLYLWFGVVSSISTERVIDAERERKRGE